MTIVQIYILDMQPCNSPSPLLWSAVPPSGIKQNCIWCNTAATHLPHTHLCRVTVVSSMSHRAAVTLRAGEYVGQSDSLLWNQDLSVWRWLKSLRCGQIHLSLSFSLYLFLFPACKQTVWAPHNNIWFTGWSVCLCVCVCCGCGDSPISQGQKAIPHTVNHPF